MVSCPPQLASCRAEDVRRRRACVPSRTIHPSPRDLCTATRPHTHRQRGAWAVGQPGSSLLRVDALSTRERASVQQHGGGSVQHSTTISLAFPRLACRRATSGMKMRLLTLQLLTRTHALRRPQCAITPTGRQRRRIDRLRRAPVQI